MGTKSDTCKCVKDVHFKFKGGQIQIPWYRLGVEVDKNHQETCGAEQNNKTKKQIKTIKPLGS